MAACPNCLYGVGRLDTRCGHCGSELSPEAAEAAVAERLQLVPRPPYQLGESVIPGVLCIAGVAAIVTGGVFALTLAGSEATVDQTTKLTVLLANGAVMTIIGFWSIMRQMGHFRVATTTLHAPTARRK